MHVPVGANPCAPVCSWQVRALKLLPTYYAAHLPSQPAADSAHALHTITLPRVLAAACSPVRAVRAAALDALPELASALSPDAPDGALAAAYLSALAAAVSEQRAALEADANATPAALRLSLQHAARAATDTGPPADSRHALADSPVAVTRIDWFVLQGSGR